MSPQDPFSDEEPGTQRDPSAELEAALERSRRHARAALAEALACAHALLDAAALATSGVPAASHGWLAAFAGTLQDAAETLSPHAEGGDLLEAVAAALDDEIARWEQRADDDPDARAVLRAFLGVRELLWELGVRRDSGVRRRSSRVTRPEPRVQRVNVQGSPGA